ncbi:MAG TPA: hypothetical protein VHG32_18500 [Thermoanaerobaculia bacterium]|nr:hypothetical protein [Thermoanaerobaculia bacterium]
MTDLARRALRLSPLALLIAVLPLAACHKSEETPAAGTPPAAGAAPAATAPASAPAGAPAASTAPLKVVALTIGKSVGADQKVTTEADTFAPGDTVYAAVGTTGASPAAKLTVRWASVSRSGAEKPAGDETKSIAPTGDAATVFQFAKPGGLATGDYKIEVLLDGQSVATKAFRVAR